MEKYLKYKGKYALMGLLALSFISVVFIIVRTKQTTNNPPLQTPSTKSIDWSKLIPGTSTTKDVVSILGNPINQKDNTYFFKSSTEVANNEAIIENGTAQFFKEIITLSDKKITTDITSKYGLAPNTLYGPGSVNGFNLYVYPSQGVAYLGNSLTLDVLETWYFQPTDINSFIQKWGNGYSITPPKGSF